MTAKKPLSVEWSRRAEHDLAQIECYYFEEAGERLSEMAGDAIYWQVQRIASNHLKFREGKANTRECVMQGWPYYHRLQNRHSKGARSPRLAPAPQLLQYPEIAVHYGVIHKNLPGSEQHP